MDIKEILEKCILTEEEKNEFQKRLEGIDHSPASDYWTMMNPIRRDIIKIIGYEAKLTKDLADALGLDEEQINYHLSIVEQSMYLINSKDGWKLTPRGIGFLINTSIEF